MLREDRMARKVPPSVSVERERPQENHTNYRAIVDTAVDAIAVIDELGMIQSFNRAAEKIFGYDAAGIVGRNVSILMSEVAGRTHNAHLGNYRRTGNATVIGVWREVEGRR